MFDSHRPDCFWGIPIYYSPHAVVRGVPVVHPRSWRDRLLSWPWRPWVASYTTTPMVPGILKTEQGWFVHPALKEHIERLADSAERPVDLGF